MITAAFSRRVLCSHTRRTSVISGPLFPKSDYPLVVELQEPRISRRARSGGLMQLPSKIVSFPSAARQYSTENLYNSVIPPAPARSAKWNIGSMEKYKEMCAAAEKDFEGFWRKLALEHIDWIKPFDQVLDDSTAPFYRWFVGGTLNASYHCIDRHIERGLGDRAAIVFEGEPGSVRKITYKQLRYEVCKLGNALKNQYGIKKGDRVVVYMPMIPEAAFAMLACIRIGAIHSVVFGGFSEEALCDRIVDGGARLVITADGGFRRGKPNLLKPTVDLALDLVEKSAGRRDVNVLVVKRVSQPINMVEGRDQWYEPVVQRESSMCHMEEMGAEDPLFLMYTSGSTGRPKGVQHATAGYLLWAQLSALWMLNLDSKEGDVLFSTGDIAWILGHTFGVYAPLSLGVTSVMYEGIVSHPHPGRPWEMVQAHDVTHFFTAPTAIRLLAKAGPEEPRKYDLTSLKVLASAGEPIGPEAWMWYYQEVGGSRCLVIDNWWQTETGGPVVSGIPGATPLKPGSASFPLPGMFVDILHEDGTKVAPGEQGLLCITKPWPSMVRNIWGDPQRLISSYYSQIPPKEDDDYIYVTGDGACYDKDGYIWVSGRVDDVINICGHRLGTAEIEAAMCHCPLVAEAAVVAKPDAIKGSAIHAFIVLKDEFASMAFAEVTTSVNGSITHSIGSLARADTITIVPALPKTRSGKIVRRILRSLACSEPLKGDFSTLEDPAVVQRVIQAMQRRQPTVSAAAGS